MAQSKISAYRESGGLHFRRERPVLNICHFRNLLAASPGAYGALSLPAWWGAGLVGVLEYL